MAICLQRGANDLHNPADATATPSSLAAVISRIAYLSGAGLNYPGCPGKKVVKRM